MRLFETDDSVSLWLQIIAVALVIAILITGGLLIGWNAFISKILGERYISNGGADINNSTINEGEGEIIDHETLDPIIDNSEEPGNIDPAESINDSQLSSLQANIKSWMNTGTAVHSKDVINILLVGQDIDKTRADAMMIVSLNKKTKVITLASLFRDQYAYIVKGNQGRFEKLHHACARGGFPLQIEMIERYYKVTIDNYIALDFTTLPKVIDAVGGVEVELNQAEADYMRNPPAPMEWKFPRITKAGTYTLSGYEALIYMRIRKGNTGGDTARVNRQQKVVKQLLANAKSYSMSQMVSMVSAVMPYLRTGLSATEILGYATTALTDGWLKYEIKQVSLPDSSCAKGFTVNKLWYWKVDYPVSAQKLQTALYGTTNIKLDPNRKSWLKL